MAFQRPKTNTIVLYRYKAEHVYGITKYLCKIFKNHNWQEFLQDPHTHQPRVIQTCYKCPNRCMPSIHAFLSNLFRAKQLTTFVQNSWMLSGGKADTTSAKVSVFYCEHTSPAEAHSLTIMQKHLHSWSVQQIYDTFQNTLNQTMDVRKYQQITIYAAAVCYYLRSMVKSN